MTVFGAAGEALIPGVARWDRHGGGRVLSVLHASPPIKVHI